MKNMAAGLRLRPKAAIARLLLGMLALIVSCNVWAADPTCTGGMPTVTLSMPATVAIPPDATVGTPLTPWVSSPATSNTFTCYIAAATAQNAAGMRFYAVAASTGQTVVNAAVTSGVAQVFQTSLAGVGIAIAVRASALGCGWQPWSSITGVACNGGHYPNQEYLGAQIQVALVKTGPITPGQVTGEAVMTAVPAYAIGPPGNLSPYTSFPGLVITFSTTPTTVTILSCLTPDVLVPMGTHASTEFSGSGYTAPVSFNIALNACPAGMNSIQYRIDPVTSVVGPSVVALDGSSRATGVGMQLLDGAGAVFPLSTRKTFSGYNASTGGSYSIPMKARYFQTGTRVSGGPANSSMTFTMTYE